MKLREVHKDVERYLAEDCYCPNEVYSVDGFGLASFIWLTVWQCFEETEIGSAISKKITECIERNKHDSKE